MAKYEFAFKKSVAKDLRSIPKKDVTRIYKESYLPKSGIEFGRECAVMKFVRMN